MYRSHHVRLPPWTPFQRKIPVNINARSTRSMINVEKIKILACRAG